jgi:hypothetical protein
VAAIESAVAYEFHQPAHALFAPGAKRRDDLVITEARGERLERNRQFSRVDTQAREGATRA